MVKQKVKRNEKVRLLAIAVIGALVIVTGSLFSYMSFVKGDVWGGVVGIISALVILGFAVFVYRRGNRDLRAGYPLKDERSRRVIERATYMAFLVSLYLLLAIGWLSEGVLKFRDVSQATSIAVGGMAILFGVFWVYYNRKGV